MIDLLEELLSYASDSLIILYMVLAVIILTIITHFIFRKRNRLIKYLPGIFVLLYGIFNLYTVLDSLVEHESLDVLMSFVIYGVSGSVGIFSALILGIYEKPRKTKKKKKEVKEKNEVKKEEKQKT